MDLAGTWLSRAAPLLNAGVSSKDSRVHPCGTTPVTGKRLVREITFARVAITGILPAGFSLLQITPSGFFMHRPYFRSFLFRIVGFALLVITYLLKQ
jgi:hypothetical protein